MIGIIFCSLLLILTTLAFSFLEAAALLGGGAEQIANSESSRLPDEQGAKGVASTGKVVAVMVIVRAQLAVALSVWIAENASTIMPTNLFLVSGVITTAAVLSEVVAKVSAIRFPVHARRAVRPFRKYLARVKLSGFFFGR